MSIVIFKGKVEQNDGTYLYYEYDTELRKVVRTLTEEEYETRHKPEKNIQ